MSSPLKDVVGQQVAEPVLSSNLCQCSEASFVCYMYKMSERNSKYQNKLHKWSQISVPGLHGRRKIGCAKRRYCTSSRVTSTEDGDWREVDITAEPGTEADVQIEWTQHGCVTTSECTEAYEGTMRRRKITTTCVWDPIEPWNGTLNLLEEERKGDRRSLCGFCNKIIPSKADMEAQRALQ